MGTGTLNSELSPVPSVGGEFWKGLGTCSPTEKRSKSEAPNLVSCSSDTNNTFIHVSSCLSLAQWERFCRVWSCLSLSEEKLDIIPSS